MLKSFSSALLAFLVTFALLNGSDTLCSAQQGKSAPIKVGNVSITSATSTFGANYVVYTDAHMKTETGTTLDADQLKVNIAKASGGLSNVVASGHVRAHMADVANGRDYLLNANKAVYDPKLKTIELTGNVETDVQSAYTLGPFKQRGSSATVDLAQNPPVITMHDVTANFTPQQ